MSRVCVALLVAAGLVGGTGLTAVAQDPVEIAFEFTSQDGMQAGTITIRDIAEDFTGFVPEDPPGPGLRYVGLTVRFEAAQDMRFNAEPSRIRIQDSEGYVYRPADITRPPDALPPVVSGQLLQPGDRVSGLVGFELPRDAVIDEILYSPTPVDDPTVTYRPQSGDRLLTMMDRQPNEIPPLGTAVSDTSPDGTLAGTVTVRGVTDPFTPFVSIGPPAPSGAVASPPVEIPARPDVRYVLVDVVFEAAEDKPFRAVPWSIVLHDTQGNQWGYETVALPPDATTGALADRTLGPDDRASGVVGFAVPSSAVIDQVLYEPLYAVRRVPLADLTIDE